MQTHAPAFPPMAEAISLFVQGLFAEHAGCVYAATPCFIVMQIYRKEDNTKSPQKKKRFEALLEGTSTEAFPKQGDPEKLIFMSQVTNL